MIKKLKVALIASVLAGSFSFTYAGWFPFSSTYEKAESARAKGNYAEATKLYAQSCNEGNFRGCNDSGYMYEHGLGAIKDNIKANELYVKACNGGNLNGCDNLKRLNAMQEDVFRKSSLFSNALKNCQAGSTDWCGALGAHYYKGEGIGENLNLAETYLQQSCDAGYGIWCGWLGALSYNKKDYFKAFESFNKACNSGIAEQCNDVGDLYKNGQGTRLDIEKAADFYGKACDMKNQQGCENYKRLKSPQPIQQAVNNNSNSNYQQEQLDIQRQQLQQEKNQAASQWLQNIQNQSNTNMQINNMMNSTYKGFDASKKGVNFNR